MNASLCLRNIQTFFRTCHSYKSKTAFFLHLLAIAAVFCLRFEKARKDCVKEGLIHS